MDVIEAATGGVLWKKVFLEISENSQENTCASGLRSAALLIKRLWHRCFPLDFVNFLRTPFLQNTSGRLLLELVWDIIRIDFEEFFKKVSNINLWLSPENCF